MARHNTMTTARAEWLHAYRWQRRCKGDFVMPDNYRIRDHLRSLFSEPYWIRGRMASGRPARMLNFRWRDMRPIAKGMIDGR
jgi:hypothetical protein